ncbi:flippase-like domain-containing protein [Nanohaloarchaea archaeon]|nr:flippase-like domain-containing protein [Candidatus Nanohaloarchaea archaeon]
MIENNRLKLAGKYSLSLALVLILALLADTGKIASILANVKPVTYFFGVLVFLSIYIWSGFRWIALTKSLGYSMDLKSSLKLIIVSYGFNKLLPLNSGDLTRSKIMEKYTDIESHGKVLGAVVMERFLDVAFLGFITCVGAFTALEIRSEIFAVLILTIILCLFLILVYWKSEIFDRILENLEDYGLPQNISELFSDGISGFTAISKSEFAEVVVWQTIRWMAGVSVIYVLAISLGTPISIAEAALVTGVMNLFSVLPLTPAGIGPVEAAGTGMLVLIGFSVPESAALVILKRSLGLVLMGGLGAVVYALD